MLVIRNAEPVVVQRFSIEDYVTKLVNSLKAHFQTIVTTFKLLAVYQSFWLSQANYTRQGLSQRMLIPFLRK